MEPGDVFIISSEFHKMDVGLIFLNENSEQKIFLPLLLNNNFFDNTEECILNGKIKTSEIIFSSRTYPEIIGLFVIHEFKKTPSFLKEYCTQNKPFLNIEVNIDKINLFGKSTGKHNFIIGGGTSLLPDRSMFDKLFIQSLVMDDPRNNKSDLSLVLK
jgi:hypothetical protein